MYVPSMPDIFISQSGIQQLLTMLDEHKASGPDCISSYMQLVTILSIDLIDFQFLHACISLSHYA